MDMTYLGFQEVFECHLRERKNFCNLRKRCKMCKRFKMLVMSYQTLTLNSNRKYSIYTTAVRYNAENHGYPKTLCMTTDIFRYDSVDDLFLQKIAEKENNLEKVTNECRKENLW